MVLKAKFALYVYVIAELQSRVVVYRIYAACTLLVEPQKFTCRRFWKLQDDHQGNSSDHYTDHERTSMLYKQKDLPRSVCSSTGLSPSHSVRTCHMIALSSLLIVLSNFEKKNSMTSNAEGASRAS